jgi:type VI secretion system secreted protein Hcp
VAAVDYFLKLTDIQGDSFDKFHPNEIQIDSFSFGASQSGVVAGGGAGTGKVQFQNFHFTTHSSKASPKLLQACATGVHLKEAMIVMRKAGETPHEFMHIKLNDVLISSYSLNGEGAMIPTDSSAMAFMKVDFAFIPQTPTGGLGVPISVGWDLKANKAL